MPPLKQLVFATLYSCWPQIGLDFPWNYFAIPQHLLASDLTYSSIAFLLRPIYSHNILVTNNLCFRICTSGCRPYQISSIIRLLFPFNYPINCAALICGGISTSMWMWSGQHLAYRIAHPLLSYPLSIHPISAFIFPYTSFLRYFSENTITMWFYHLRLECVKLYMSLIDKTSFCFWCRGYFVDTVGKNEKMIQEYIRNQLEEDLASDQISLKEYMDPFTGSKRK